MPLSQGLSGAAVAGLDISGETGELAPGIYVLRVGPDDDRQTQPNIRAAHDLLRKPSPGFARDHIPRLVHLHATGEGEERLVITLHEAAGGGLRRYISPRTRSTGLLRTVRRLSEELLTAWSAPHDMRRKSPYELLVDLVGQDRANACLDVAETFFPGGRTTVSGDLAFLDPRQILGPERAGPQRVMYGICHGDLNTGNLLVPVDERVDTDTGYSIVDLGRAHPGAVGFDLAYLEVSVLVNLMPDLAPGVLARCLKSADDAVRRSVPDDTDWLMGFLEESRGGAHEWISGQQGRLDQLNHQFLLVRMIAGLLWAQRFPANSSRARLCLAYAGYYALRYNGVLGEEAATPDTEADTDADGQRREEAEEALWQSLWEAVSGFAPHAARYVLITERMPSAATVASLGRIPWSLVVDLDPRSDGDGLRHRAGPVLEAQRAVHLFTREQPLVDYARGTAWMLAVGSVLRNEPPDDLRNWGYRRLNSIRQVASSFRQAVGDIPVFVVVLEGEGRNAPGTERDRLLRAVGAVDEGLQGHGTFLHVGSSSLGTGVESTSLPLPLPALLDRLTETLGLVPEQVDFTVPALDKGTAAISPETMQKLREHLVVLHDGIELTVAPSGNRHNDEFWRGGLISWADLDLGRDVPRTITDSLVTTLRDTLEQHRTRTVLLHHKPGTGGTTVALRAAWDLHHEYPVTVLPHGVTVDRARVPLIADRLNLLYSRTQQPVLLVAESGDLSESDREALYQELAKRGARVTVLYVRRGVGDAGQGALEVGQWLNATETKDFEQRYSELVLEPGRISQLKQLSRKQYERYRTPFFYGLITFERKFTKLSDYVNTHLEQVRGRAGEVMLYLALVTVFSNTGLQRELVHKLMRHSSTTSYLELADVLGPEAARLVAVRSGRVRLQHQLIAEQVLAGLLNDDRWYYYLKDKSIDFIEALASTTDVSSEPVRVLLRQMFVERQGGSVDGVEDRGYFAPLIERLDTNSAHAVLRSLTQHIPDEPHFWNHLGRHQMYGLDREYDKAEEYVTRAVALAENDFIHHHTLGLTRRGILKQALKRAQSHGVTAVRRAVEEHYERTVECFETSRRLNRENLHGYITHVQTIITVAQTFKASARIRSIAELDTAAGDWVAEKVAEANALLHEATQAYGTLDDQDSYVVRCRADIRQLYGDLDAVVEMWEVAVTGRRSTPMVQRALAQAYYLRGEGRWRNLGHAELRRVAELARQNLARYDCREEDYRLWFEAYKQLPEFDVNEALSQLQLWSDRFPSWRAHYYRYCLLFHLWFTNRSNHVEPFRHEQQQSRELVFGRSKWSYLWLAKGPQWYPAIADSDLGEWDRKKTFWKHTDQLQRVNGLIDVMRNPWSGDIKLDGSVTAFFVPNRGEFLPDGDENTEVNFFLGMSPDGLQAWEVRRGHLPHAVSAREATGPPVLLSVPPAQAAPEPTRVSTDALSARAAQIRDDQKLAYILSLLKAWQEVDQTPRLSALTERVSARYRYDAADVEALLERTNQVRYIGGGEDPEIRFGEVVPPRQPAVRTAQTASRHLAARPGQKVLGRVLQVYEAKRTVTVVYADEQWATLRYEEDIVSPPGQIPQRGQLLWMVRELDQRGGCLAREVELLPLNSTKVGDELIAEEDLLERIESDLRDELEARFGGGARRVAEAEMAEWLEDRFTGCLPLAERLGLGDLSGLWSGLDWLRRDGTGRTATLSPATTAVFGRVSLPAQAGQMPAARSGTPLPRFGEALAAAVDGLRQRDGSGAATFGAVMKALKNALGQDFTRVVGPHGGKSLRNKILKEPGWELVGKPPLPDVVRRQGDSVLKDAVDSIEARGQEPTLAAVGVAMRERLADDYDDTVGRSLKRWLERQPDWEVREERPGHEVARYVGDAVPSPTGPPDQAPPAAAAAPFVEPDVAKDLEDVIAALSTEGKAAPLTGVGSRLSALWGAGTYKRVTARRRLPALAADHGWEVFEARPDVHCLRRPASSADEEGGTQ
ncbi:P-loop NTPase [Streptomyces sp. NPDC004288]